MIVIGEKINGAIPSVAKAIENRDADWIRNLAKIQTDAGADFIDVCAGGNPDLVGIMQIHNRFPPDSKQFICPLYIQMVRCHHKY